MESQRTTGPAHPQKTRAHRSRAGMSLVALISLLAAVLAVTPAASGSAMLQADPENPVLVESGPIVGSTNGMFFDGDGNLWVASVFGQKISKIDSETGTILEQWGQAEGVFFPDDLTVGPDGSVYWTDIIFGAVYKRALTGATIPLVEPGGLQNANPITISEDGTRLFAAGCYGEVLDLAEIDPVNGGIVSTIIDDHPGCASNAMDFVDGAIWSPRPFEGRVVRVDVETGEETNVTVDWAAPIAVKFNSAGELHAGSQGTGEVVRIDHTNPDPTANRTVLATFPIGWIDNLAFDADDRLFVSSATDGAIVEILEDGSIREVVPGQYSLPLGLGVIGDDIYSANGQQLLQFDKRTGETKQITQSVAGLGPLPFLLGLSAWGDQLVGLDAFFGQVAIVDPVAGAVVASTSAGAPADALGFDGDLLVSDYGTGEVFRLNGSNLDERETVATVALPLGLAGDDNDAYVTSFATGQVLQIIDDGNVLTEPIVIASDLAGPEGLTMHNRGRSLVVFEGVTGVLTQIDLATGETSVVATGLTVQPGNPVFPFGFFNDVVSDGEALFAAADGSNLIHRWETCAGMTEAQAIAAGYAVDDRSQATSGQTIVGTSGDDWIIGSEHSDRISGLGGHDAICSRSSRDVVNAGSGHDVVDAGRGRDVVNGAAGRDLLLGNRGADLLRGGGGSDTLDGGPGNDRLRGNRGNDTLIGGPGSDAMRGGPGRDVCVDATSEDRPRSC